MKNNIVAIIQARMNSTRLNGKVLKVINGITFLELLIRRLKNCKNITKIVLAFPENDSSLPLIKLSKKIRVDYVLGSEDNLLLRYKKAALETNADYIIRVTSDCPLVDPLLLDNMISLILKNKYDIITNVIPPTWPDGLDINIFTKHLLLETNKLAILNSDKEHVVPWMWRNSELKNNKKYRGYNYKCKKDYSNLRWTLDNKADLLFFTKLSEELSLHELEKISFEELIEFFRNHKELTKINAGNIRDIGYTNSLNFDHENK